MRSYCTGGWVPRWPTGNCTGEADASGRGLFLPDTHINLAAQ